MRIQCPNQMQCFALTTIELNVQIHFAYVMILIDFSLIKACFAFVFHPCSRQFEHYLYCIDLTLRLRLVHFCFYKIVYAFLKIDP